MYHSAILGDTLSLLGVYGLIKAGLWDSPSPGLELLSRLWHSMECNWFTMGMSVLMEKQFFFHCIERMNVTEVIISTASTPRYLLVPIKWNSKRLGSYLPKLDCMIYIVIIINPFLNIMQQSYRICKGKIQNSPGHCQVGFIWLSDILLFTAKSKNSGFLRFHPSISPYFIALWGKFNSRNSASLIMYHIENSLFLQRRIHISSKLEFQKEN